VCLSLRFERSPWHKQCVLCAHYIQKMHRGNFLNKLDLQGKLQTKFGPGSTTRENAEHPGFIMNQAGEEIMLEDSEFMVMRCSK
jgi:hypothetical protein